jgi:HK97 family phage major capsid protein
MNEEVKTLYDERLRIDHDQRQMLDKAEEENRSLTDDEQTQYDAMDERFNEIDVEIKAIEEQDKTKRAREEKHEARQEMFKAVVNEPIKMDPISTEEENRQQATLNYRATDEYNTAFRSFLTGGVHGLGEDEVRALQADQDTVGGFLVAPEQFVSQLIQDKDRMLWIRQFATTFQVPNAASLGAPELDTDPADGDWTAEIRTGAEDSDMNFEKRALHPHPLAKRIKVANRLVRAAVMDIEGLVRGRLAYKFGVTEEKAFMSGGGGGQPLGIFTASDDGITTGRDVSTNNTASNVTADNLQECVGTLEAQYRTNCRWVMHRNTITKVRKLKTGDGAYIWQPGLTSERPSTILGYPVAESEYAPNTYTTGLYVAILGDFSFYWIADALDMTVAVLTELYAETNQIGYIGRQETDGAPVHEKAFVRSKLG